jgi:Mn2+/Fe2+ NRAMP family transporter
MQFYAAAAVADRGIGPADYPGERLDTVAGSVFCNVISTFILVATAAAIHVRAPLEPAKQAAGALAPVAGRFATQLFAAGLLGASALAAAVVPLPAANGPAFKIIATISVAAVAILSATVLAQTVLGSLGIA